MDIFNRMNLMNRRGSGLLNITNRTNKLFNDGRNHVTYKTDGGFFIVRIENAKYKMRIDGEEDIPEVDVDLKTFLTTNELIVYDTLKENPRLSYDELSKETKIPRRTIARVVAALVEKGYIKRGGSVGKSGYWVILK